ncbi:MAG: Uma2 family endonuclease [Thermomicrobiales bacterium]
MSATTKLYTAEDLWHMPGDEPWELWEGELRKVPSAGGEASALAGWILVLLVHFVRPRRLGMVTGADGTYIMLHDPQTVLVPDVAFVRWERLPDGAPPKRYIPVPPDLAVEVRSPSDRPGEISQKLALYQRAGVPLVWWVDPARRAVTVHRLGHPVVDLHQGDELDGADILPGFRLPVADIFDAYSTTRPR